MKHVGPAALDRLEPLLDKLRRLSALKEKSRGIFYRGGHAFLHFHEHGAEFYADLKTSEEFERFPATSTKEREALLRRIDKAVKD